MGILRKVALVLFVASILPAVASSVPPRVEADREATRQARALDLATVTAFHQRLEAVTEKVALVVVYNGPLGRPRGLTGPRLEESSDTWLSWSVVAPVEPGGIFGPVLFRVQISLDKHEDDLLSRRVNDKVLHLRASPRDRSGTAERVIPGWRDGKKEAIRKLLERVGDKP